MRRGFYERRYRRLSEAAARPALLVGEVFGSDDAGEVVARTFGDLEIGFSADPRATRAHARMPLAD